MASRLAGLDVQFKIFTVVGRAIKVNLTANAFHISRIMYGNAGFGYLPFEGSGELLRIIYFVNFSLILNFLNVIIVGD